jgi:hypothetical protein
MKQHPLPTQQRLHEVYDYSVVTGELTNRKTGRVATARAYVKGKVDGTVYYAHRLIWRWVTGDDPGELHVDHVNQLVNCNAWHNLRLVSHGENQVNTTKRAGCRSATRGVHYESNTNKWFGQLYKGGKQYTTSYYNTEQECCQATETLRRQLHPHLYDHL